MPKHNADGKKLPSTSAPSQRKRKAKGSGHPAKETHDEKSVKRIGKANASEPSYASEGKVGSHVMDNAKMIDPANGLCMWGRFDDLVQCSYLVRTTLDDAQVCPPSLSPMTVSLTRTFQLGKLEFAWGYEYGSLQLASRYNVVFRMLQAVLCFPNILMGCAAFRTRRS